MQIGSVTTPFGRRPMTLGMLADQLHAREIAPNKSVDKWKLFRSLCEARKRIGVSDRSLAVLNALLSFYPKSDLSNENALVVFPSNAQLSLRTHGMADTTLRRHLAALVDAGLIFRKDSPNGKRYARKERGGAVSDAFGFSLAPLLARADTIDRLASEVIAERQLDKRQREQISLCRRDIAKLFETASIENIPGDWSELQDRFTASSCALPRSSQPSELAQALKQLEEIRELTVKRFELHVNVANASASDTHIGGHIQSSDINPISESEATPPALAQVQRNLEGTNRPTPINAYPLEMVLKACPEVTLYGPGGAISSWKDLINAGQVVRSMLAVSLTAHQRACNVLGPANAAIVLACILERSEQITSAGGYLRDLTQKAEKGTFSIGPMLMALLRGRTSEKLAA